MSKSNYSVARSLNHTFRYIDDISPLNDNGNFEKYKSQIYPDDLELNRENTGFKLASVLRLMLLKMCLVAMFTVVGALGQAK